MPRYTERQHHASRRLAPAAGPERERPTHALVQLGQTMGNAAVSRALAQREGMPEEEEELMMSRESPTVGPEGGAVDQPTTARINSLRGGGSALDEGTRLQMEGALGASFEAVRVHTGAEAASLSRALGARAFTTGNDVFLGDGASTSDRGLMAHELTHVVQQGGTSGGGPLTVSSARDPHEAEAEANARAVSSGQVALHRADDLSG